MIANLNLWFLLALIFAVGQIGFGKSHFRQIAIDYNIHPFEFSSGYPLWYEWDESPVRGIIFLSNEMEYLEKLDGRTYVGQPSIENAEVIANFSAAPIDLPLYYVVVDSLVSQYEMNEFLKKLGENDPYVDIRFVGDKGEYIEVRYENKGYFKGEQGPFCGIRSQTDIFINSRNDLMLESRCVQFPEIAKYHNLHYGHNFPENRDECFDCPNKRLLGVDRSLNYIDLLKMKIENEPKNSWLAREHEQYKKILELTLKHDTIFEMTRPFPTHIRLQRGTALRAYFDVLDQVKSGIFMARNKYSVKMWNESYIKILSQRNTDLLLILRITFPDDLIFSFGQSIYDRIEVVPERAPQPPIIEPGACFGDEKEE